MVECGSGVEMSYLDCSLTFENRELSEWEGEGES